MSEIIVLRDSSPLLFDVEGMGAPGSPGPAGDVARSATRAALAAIVGAPVGTSRHLSEAGRQGIFEFSTDAGDATKATTDTPGGIYVAGVGGTWVRKFSGPWNPLWFGIVEGSAAGANGAANSTVLAAMLATMRTRAKNNIGLYQGLESILFPAGYFEFGSTIEITDGTTILEGAGTGQSGGIPTWFKFPAATTGIRVQNYDTTGLSGTRANAISGAGSIIRNLMVEGAISGNPVTEGETHGIQLRARATVEHCRVASFAGDGIYINAGVGAGTYEGNANSFQVMFCIVNGCRNGLYVNGADANAGTVVGGDYSHNRRWGVWDSSFLGNTYVGVHSASNGWDGAEFSIPTGSTLSGNRYYVKVGQEAGASTNSPSGTTADNTWWGYTGPGGAFNGIVAWVSGTTFRTGGAYHTDDVSARNLFAGCYSESDQNTAQIAGSSLVVGGLHGAGTGGYAGVVNAGTTGALLLTGIFNAVAPITTNQAVILTGSAGGNQTIQATGAASKLVLEETGGTLGTARLTLEAEATLGAIFETTHVSAQLVDFKFRTSAAGDHAVRYERRVGSFVDAGNATWEFQFGTAGAAAHSFGDAGIKTSGYVTATGAVSGSQFKVSGTKVVGAQGAAVADGVNAVAAPTQAEFNALVTQINALLARVRTHGLIAT